MHDARSDTQSPIVGATLSPTAAASGQFHAVPTGEEGQDENEGNRQAKKKNRTQPRRWTRIGAAVIAIGLTSLLVTARSLEPNKEGLGTHQQLGLAPCSAITMFGVECPACGMTTSWSHLTRGQIEASLNANSAGTLLGLFSIAVVLAATWTIRSGKSPSNRQLWIWTYALLVVMGWSLVRWTYRLF